MKINVILERGIDGSYDATLEYHKNVPFGLLGQGKTVAETINDFTNSANEMKAFYAEEGKEFPNLEFVYKYDVPSFLQYYAYAFTLAGLERITGVNQKQLGHYINGVRKPSKKTVKQIEERILEFGREIASVRFL
ncbi:helix-turn-helix transcriptional regulator [Parabacteroides sp. OttesenSCG-928-N08]|nr:helix-turn-helix transcriptional regulator [Parabacteroides sp. OttesenSCG-928-N08]